MAKVNISMTYVLALYSVSSVLSNNVFLPTFWHTDIFNNPKVWLRYRNASEIRIRI